MTARVRRRDTAGVLAAVDRFCRYYHVMHAYIDDGRIVSSVDRGAFVRPQDALPPAFMALLGERRDSHSYAYGPEAGEDALRARIAEVENARHGTRYDASQVAIVPGAWAGVSLVLEELLGLRRGRAALGTIAVIGPTHYQLFHRAINTLGAELDVHEHTTGERHGPRADDPVDALFERRPVAVFVTNPSNPDGLYVPAAFLRRVIDRAAAHDCVVVIDEIQDFLRRPGVVGLDYGAWIAAPHVVRINSPSKRYGLADHRVGWVIASPDLLGTRTTGVIGRLNGLIGNAPRAANTAILALLDAELDQLRGAPDPCAAIHADLLAREALVKDALARLPGVEVFDAEACINLTFRLPDVRDDLETAEQLMRRGTLVMPCGGYGYRPDDGVFRITFAERRGKLAHALDCLGDLVRSSAQPQRISR